MTGTLLLAGLCGSLVAAGLVLLLRQLVPSLDVAPAPPPRLVRTARLLWYGPGRSTRSRRRYRTTTVAAVSAGTATWLASGLPVLAAAATAAVPGVPWLLGAAAAERAAIARIEAVGEWTRRLRDVTDTGAGLQSALLSTVATAPPAIAEPAGTLAARLQAGGNARQALLGFADEIDDPVGDQVVAALLLHLRDRGEQLGPVLAAIGESASQEAAVRKEADAERSGARFSIKFMIGFTVLVGVAAAVAGDYMSPYATPVGQVLMAALAAGFIGVLLWVRTLTSPPRAPRLLGPPQPGVGQ